MQIFILVHRTYPESLRVIEVRFSGQAIENRVRNVITHMH